VFGVFHEEKVMQIFATVHAAYSSRTPELIDTEQTRLSA
jgi:hypothetical protein